MTEAILADESFAETFRSLENCVSVKNNLCGKLVSSLESSVTFDQKYKVTLLPFFIPDFKLFWNRKFDV